MYQPVSTSMYEDEDEPVMYRPRKSTDKRCLAITIVVGVVVFVIGIVIGRYAVCPKSEANVPDGLYLKGVPKDLMRDEDLSIVNSMLEQVSSDNIRDHLKILADLPHLAGLHENDELAKMIQKHWEDVGLDHVTMTPYYVLLSYPNASDPNYVELLDSNNTTMFKSPLKEAVLTPEENKTNVVPPFNSYSGFGDVFGTIVYVNYGRVEDYLYLEANTSINITGKIVMARYGKIYRGDKVRLAETRGASAVILFSDPEDVTNGNTSQVYPHDWYLPPSGVQRGSVLVGDGDPLTPGYPAISTAYHKKAPETFMPKIPVHPVGYGFAVELMRNIGGENVSEEWRGGMNVTYRYGDSFTTQGWKAHVHVMTKNQNVSIYNVIGIIKGELEPDRYVLIGNHRDAWVFGAQDPSSGTAVMMEISRVLGNLVKSGKWRPRRTIMFCSWDAEEYGLTGSAEFVEHYTKSLGARAVAYLNVDIAIEGNFSFWARGTPSLFNPVISATQKVTDPDGTTTVFDKWVKTFPSKGNPGKPLIKLPGSGSDHAFFRDQLAVPIIDFGFTSDPKGPVEAYPMYHSMYETFYLVDKIMDRGFKRHRAVGQVWLELARHLADTLIIPFDLTDYSSFVNEMATEFFSRFKDQLENKGINTTLLTEAVSNFTKGIEDFKGQMKLANLNNPFVVRRINDQLMQLNRAFLDPEGLPGRKLKRHILFAESSVNSYSGTTFPGLADALTEILQRHDVDKQWEIVRQHYSVVLFTLQSATSTLKDVTEFMYNYY